MNTRRLLSAWLLAVTIGLTASAQDSAELAALRAKAEKGNGIAQYNLGLAYTRGGEVAIDSAEAFTWLTLAQENGARGKALEALVASMDKASLNAAQKRLAARRVELGGPIPNGLPATATSITDEGAARLRAQRDELSAKITELAPEVASLRAERDRLTKLVAEHEKAAQTSAAELAQARNFAQQVESTLNKVNDQKAELESRLRAAQTAAPAPTVESDELKAANARIKQLEALLVEAPRSRTPAYADLSGRVAELEAQLADARRTPEPVAASETAASTPTTATGDVDVAALQKKLAETEDKLSTALRGYAFLQRQTTEKATAASKASEAVASERNDAVMRLAETDSRATAAKAEVLRLNEELAALRASTAKDTEELAATRAVLKQVQGTSAMLAKENYQLKARLSPNPTPLTGSVVSASEPTPVITESSTAPAAVEAAPVRTHVVVSGDSLSKIAQKYYGDSKRWPEIYNANREKLGNEGSLKIGSELRIP